MSEYSSNRPGIPLTTNGYVSAVSDRFIYQTVLSDGTSIPANIHVEDMARVLFSVQHAAIRMTVKSVGGINGNIVRSEGVSMNISQKSIRLGISSRQVNLSLSKN